MDNKIYTHELFISFLKKNNAWEEFEHNRVNDYFIDEPICWILSAFKWINYDIKYWIDINDKWLEELRKNKVNINREKKLRRILK